MVALEGAHSLFPVALLFALAEKRAVIVPVGPQSPSREQLDELPVEYFVSGTNRANLKIESSGKANNHLLVKKIREAGAAGLVVFSSGTTGKPKGVLHDFSHILASFAGAKPMRTNRIAAFNTFDRIAGVFMLLNSLSSGSALVQLRDRQPDTVAAAIEQFKIDVLPTSPSFLNLLLLSGALEKYDLSSLKQINYGSEPVTEYVVRELRRRLPWVKLKQIFGTSELGLIKTKTESSDSLHFTSNDPQVQIRVRNGMFEVKSHHAMLGYLANESAAFTEDGWMATGDFAEEKNGMVRVLGRKSEAINLGGNLVNPIEVENVLQALSNVAQVTVCGEENALLGQIVKAVVCLQNPESSAAFRKRLLKHCEGKLERFKIPQKIEIVGQGEFVGDFKKKRFL